MPLQKDQPNANVLHRYVPGLTHQQYTISRAPIQSIPQLCYLYLAVFSHPQFFCWHLRALFPVLFTVDLKHKSITILLLMHNCTNTYYHTSRPKSRLPLAPPLPYSETYLILSVFPPTTQIIFTALPGLLFKLQSTVRHPIML